MYYPKKLHFAHAYGYAAAIAQRLTSSEGQSELLEWLDPESLEFREAIGKPQKKSVLHQLIFDLAFF